MPATLSEILDRLANVQSHGDYYMASCPAHDDQTPSLKIKLQPSQKITMTCYAGCHIADICPKIDIHPRDLYPDEQPAAYNSKRPWDWEAQGYLAAVYTYTDANSRPVFQVLRSTYKHFAQRAPDPSKASGYEYKTKHLEKPIYNLPAVLQAIELNKTILFVEGEKDVETARRHGIFATCIAEGAAQSLQRHHIDILSQARVLIVPDNDDAGRNFAHRANQALPGATILTLPGLPPKGDLTDWFQQGGTKQALQELAATAFVAGESTPAEPIQVVDWPEPQPIPRLEPVPALDYGLLPQAFRGWITDVCRRNPYPVEYLAAGALVTASAALGRRIAVAVDGVESEFVVVPNLWGMIVGSPSTSKTQSLNECLKPLRQLEREAEPVNEERRRAFAQELAVIDANNKRVEKNIAKANSAADATQAARDLIPRPELPAEIRYIVEDASVEKLLDILRVNPAGVLLFRDELHGLIMSSAKEYMAGARQFYLESWNGNGSFSQDRIGRGTVKVDGVCLSVLGGLQPDRIAGYLREAHGGNDDGFLARFQIAVYPDAVELRRKQRREEADGAAYARYESAIRNLARVTPQSVGAVWSMKHRLPALPLDDYAWRIYWDWVYEYLEPTARKEGGLLENHFIKYRSIVPSIALVWHLVEGGSGLVPASRIEAAICWAGFLETHARRIYQLSGEAAATPAALLSERITELVDGFTARDIRHKGWSGLRGDAVDDALAKLEKAGWIRGDKRDTGGRPTTVYTINPAVRELAE